MWGLSICTIAHICLDMLISLAGCTIHCSFAGAASKLLKDEASGSLLFTRRCACVAAFSFKTDLSSPKMFIYSPFGAEFCFCWSFGLGVVSRPPKISWDLLTLSCYLGAMCDVRCSPVELHETPKTGARKTGFKWLMVDRGKVLHLLNNFYWLQVALFKAFSWLN